MKVLALWVATAAVGLCQYATFAETERKLTDLARQNSDVMTLDSIGLSAGGRKLYAVRIAGRGAVEPELRPAIFIGANLAGYHNAGVQLAMALLDRLITQENDLAARTYYILPVLNPDAHDSYFAKVKWRNALNGGQLDRDRDGLTGEDGPNDLNGDGRITQILFHAHHLPRLQFQDPTVVSLGPKLWRVQVPLLNDRALPSMAEMARMLKLHRPDIATVQGARMVASGIVRDPYLNQVDYQADRPERLMVYGVPAFGTTTLFFLLEGSGEVTVTYDSVKAGKLSRKIALH